MVERRRTKERLARRDQRFRLLAETAPVAMVQCNPDGLLEFYNPKAVELWGRAPAILDASDRFCGSFRIYHLDGVPMPHHENPMATVLRTGIPEVNREVIVERPDGERVTVLANVTPLKDEHGAITGAISCMLDITEQKRAEEAVRESQQLLRLVLATLPVGVVVTDRAGDIILANGAAKRIWGDMIVEGPKRWAQSQGFWHDSGKRIAPADWASVRALSGGQTSLNELIDIQTFDGREKTIQNSSAPILNAEGLIVGSVIVNEDVTDRVRAEEALQGSEQRFRQLFARAPVSIWEEDFSGVGDWLAELRVRGVHDLDAFLETEPQALKHALGLVRLVDVNDTTLRLFEANSKAELLSLWPRLFTDETFRVFAEQLRATWEGRNQVDSECSAQTVRGRPIRYLLHWVAPLDDGRMNLRRVIVVIADITKLRESEEKLHQTELELGRVARLTTMGELAASIAHEVNQPLAAVVTNANASLRWLAAVPPNLDEAREAVRRIVRDGNRAGEVIARIRTLIKKGEPVRTSLDVNEVIQETLTFAQPGLARHKVSLETELEAKLPRVHADRVQVQQVLLNLVVNALDSLSAAGERPRVLRVRTERRDPDAVWVAVQDTGIGVAPELSERLFEAFFTTKPQGLGMGLAISRSIIEAHGGRLWMTPNDGPGVTFQFALPIQDGVAT